MIIAGKRDFMRTGAEAKETGRKVFVNRNVRKTGISGRADFL